MDSNSEKSGKADKEKKSGELEQQLLSAAAVAKLFGYETVRTIERLVENGVIEAKTVKAKNGKLVRRYDLEDTIKRFVKYLQDKAKNKGFDNETAGQQADYDLRYKKARTEKIELELAELKGRMHRAEDIEAVMGDIVSGIRARLCALPGQLAVDTAQARTAAETAQIIKKAVEEVLLDLTRYKYDPVQYAELVRERAKWMNKKDGEEEEENKTSTSKRTANKPKTDKKESKTPKDRKKILKKIKNEQNEQNEQTERAIL